MRQIEETSSCEAKGFPPSAFRFPLSALRLLRKAARRAAFSLIEVNMAVFVLAVGVLSVAALYPLGLRESSQASRDVIEAALADNLLNQAVALASQPSVKWNEWNDRDKNPIIPYDTVSGGGSGGSAMTVDRFKAMDSFNDLPNFLKSGMVKPELASDSEKDVVEVRHFRIACCRPPAHSGRVMGIMVQSTVDEAYDRNDFSNRPIYYAEAYFQGQLN